MGDLEYFAPNLAQMISALNASPLVSYAIDGNLRLVYRNLAWDMFAAENNAPELVGELALGIDLHDVIGRDLLPFYLQAFNLVCQTGAEWNWLYQCSSPQVFRNFRMRIQPLRPTGWLLISNARVVERPHSIPVAYGLQSYVSVDGQITMCSHCRCSRKTDQPSQWDFVPAHFDSNLENISHGLCPVCLEYFYPNRES